MNNYHIQSQRSFNKYVTQGCDHGAVCLQFNAGIMMLVACLIISSLFGTFGPLRLCTFVTDFTSTLHKSAKQNNDTVTFVVWSGDAIENTLGLA
jgi:hypothetical protein